MEKSLLVLPLLLLLPAFKECAENQHFFELPSVEFRKLTDQENDELNEICGKLPHSSRKRTKVDNGALARRNQFPWAAVIEEHDGENIKRICSATLVSPRHAVTSAHCLFREDIYTPTCQPDEVYKNISFYCEANDAYRNGDTYLAFGGICHGAQFAEKDKGCEEDDLQRYPIVAVAAARRWRDDCKNFDFAIVEISKDIEFDTDGGSLLPACLATEAFPLPQFASFAGWGRTKSENGKEGGEFRTQLRYANGRIEADNISERDRETARGLIHFWTKGIADHEADAAELDEEATPGAALNYGDSGSGLIKRSCDYRTVVIGTASFTANYPNSYFSDVRSQVRAVCDLTGICAAERPCNY